MKRILILIGLTIFIVGCQPEKPEPPTQTAAVTPSPTAIPLTNTSTLTSTPPEKTLIPTETSDILTQFHPTPINDLSYDLAWLQEGNLLRWNPPSNEIYICMGPSENAIIKVERPIVNYHLVDQFSMVIVQEGFEEGELIIGIVDLNEHDYSTDISISSPKNIIYSISPDGQWVSYVSWVESTQNEDTGGIKHLYQVYLVNLHNGVEQLLSTCIDSKNTKASSYSMDSCDDNPIWSNDSKRLAWRGDEGIMIMEIDGEPKQIIEDSHETDWGENYYYLPHEWLFDNRYLLTERIFWEATQMVLIDTFNDRVQDIPHGESYAGSGNFFIKSLLDSRLIVLWTPDSDYTPPIVELFRLVDSGPTILTQIIKEDLRIGDEYIRDWSLSGIQLNDDKVILFAQDSDVSYRKTFSKKTFSYLEINLSDLSVSEYRELSHEIEGFYPDSNRFSPDGNWILLSNYFRGSYYLISLRNKISIKVSENILYDYCCFTWTKFEE